MECKKQSPLDGFPCTDLQKAYIYGRQNSAELYTGSHCLLEFKIPDPDEEKIEWIQEQLYNRHPMLKAEVVNGIQQRILHDVPPPPIKTVDLSQVSSVEAEKKLLLLREEYSHYWNKKAGYPALRIMITRMPDNISRIHFYYDLFCIDGLSILILLSEIEMLYNDLDNDLAQPSFRFDEYVRKIAASKKGEYYLSARDYWLKCLPEMAEGPGLPVNGTRPFIQESRMKRRIAIIEPVVWEKLWVLSQKLEISTTVLIFYCYMRTLSFWAKHPRFTVCMMISERIKNRKEIDQTIGNFGNIILVDMDFSRPVPLDEGVDILSGQINKALLHLDFNGIEVIQEINRHRTMLGKTPVPVAFVSNIGWLKSIPQRNKPDRFSLEKAVYSSLETPHMYLDHQVYELEDGLHLIWDTVDDIFPSRLPEDMLETYKQLLVHLAENHELAGQALTLPLPKYQQTLLKTVHHTSGPTSEKTLHGLFSDSAEKYPERCAVVAGDISINYSQLAEQSRRIASLILQEAGNTELPVAIVTDKNGHQMTAILGTLFAGMPYLPINPRFPEERVKQLVRLGKCRVVITEKKYQNLFEKSTDIILMDEELPRIHKDIPLPAHNAEKLAYIIFTSGSTGEPKGVMINHKAAVNTILDVNRRFNVGPEDRAFAISAVTFDLSVYDIFGMLAAGGTIVLPDSDKIHEPSYWLRLIKKERTTIWNSAPPVLQMLENYLEGESSVEKLPFRIALLSGDWIPLALPEAISGRCHECTIVSLGGATEAGIWSNFHVIDKIEPHWKSIPYGKPLANQNLYILDEQLNERPLHATGQIYIAGDSLAEGYWQDPKKTSASFIKDFRTGQRLYKTGDLGRYMADGAIEILGREDSQVKIRGYRIELGEIESVLEKHPGIRRGLVKVYDRAGEKQLAAYVTTVTSYIWDKGNSEKTFSGDDICKLIKEYLGLNLPEYMVPSAFVVLDEFPLSSSGKIDRKVLPAPGASKKEHTSTQSLPADEMEEALLFVWEKLLDKTGVGVEENFFDLGGDSFLSVRMISEIKRELGYSVSVSHLFERGTVRSLAQIIKNNEIQDTWSPLVTIRKGGNERPVYFVHPSGGNVLCYRHLSEAMGAGTAFYGLKAPGLEKNGIFPESVEDMADYYLAAIKKIRDDNNFILGGWSSGGVIAYEMACRLQKEKVPDLVIIDFPAPADYRVADEKTLLKLFLRDMNNGSIEVPDDLLREVENIPDGSMGINDNLLIRLRENIAKDMDQDQFLSIYKVFKNIINAISHYNPSRLNGNMLLIRAENNILTEHEALESDGHKGCGWQDYVGGILNIKFINGNHYTLLEKENAGVVAEIIRGHTTMN